MLRNTCSKKLVNEFVPKTAVHFSHRAQKCAALFSHRAQKCAALFSHTMQVVLRHKDKRRWMTISRTLATVVKFWLSRRAEPLPSYAQSWATWEKTSWRGVANKQKHITDTRDTEQTRSLHVPWRMLLPQVPGVEQWRSSPDQVRQMTARVRQLYVDQYVHQWFYPLSWVNDLYSTPRVFVTRRGTSSKRMTLFRRLFCRDDVTPVLFFSED